MPGEQRLGYGCLTIASAAFALVLFSWDARIVWLSLISKDWPTTEGRITSSTTSWRREKTGRKSYFPMVSYRYSAAGEEYKSSQISFHPQADGAAFASETAGLYPKDKTVTVYYEPDNPNNAVLEPGFRFSSRLVMLLVLGILCLALTGPGIILWQRDKPFNTQSHTIS